MLELIVNGKQAMQINDDNKTIIFDKNLANDVAIDIKGNSIDFELKDDETDM